MNHAFDTSQVIQAIRSVLPPNISRVALHEPQFSGNEWTYLKECLDTGWVSSVGAYVDKFEAVLAEYTGTMRAVVIVNGTAALHLCLRLVGVEPGDEVITQALTFVATANAITFCGAIPHFVDCDERSLGLDPRRLGEYLDEIAKVKNGTCINTKTSRRIRAVVPMHTFGHPVDLDPLLEICNRWSVPLVEDAAESLGSFYKGKHTGNWGVVSALSFNGNKIVTTGGGGAILTNDEATGRLAKHLSTTAKVPHRWAFEHDMLGYNYRMPNINAALGCAQMEQIDTFLSRKRALAECYRAAFANIPGIRFFSEPSFAKSNYWLNAILLDDELSSQRDKILTLANDEGIMARPAWNLMTKLPMYQKCPQMPHPVAEKAERCLINIPSSPSLASGSSRKTT